MASQRCRSHVARRGSRGLGLVAFGCLLAAALAVLGAVGAASAFTGGAFAGGAFAARHPMVYVEAEAPAPAPAPTSVALVKVTEESAATTAGVLGGAVGLLTGGVWVGAALFAASSYLSKRDDDVSKALKGVATAGLEAVNFGAYLTNKYEVTDKVSSAFDEALKSDSLKSVAPAFNSIGEAYTSVDKDIGIKDTLGTLLTSAADLASQAVDKTVELNNEYKITDQIGEKIQELTEQASKKKS